MFYRQAPENTTLENMWSPLHFMLWNGSGKPFQHIITFSCLDCILAEPEEGWALLQVDFDYLKHAKNGPRVTIYHVVLTKDLYKYV